MKLHAMLISLVFAMVIVTSFIGLFSSTAENHASTATDYNETELEEFTSKMSDVTDISTRTKERIENVRANPLIPDTLGAVVVGGIGGLLIALESTDVFIDLAFTTIEYLPIGSVQNILLAAVFAAIIIVAFIAILAHYIRPSDRL